MTDHISREAALAAMNGDINITGMENGESIYKYLKAVVDRLKQIPAADVVEVVRCKDCTIRYTACPMVVRDRGMFSFFMEDNDFCSRAKGDSDGRSDKQTGGD